MKITAGKIFECFVFLPSLNLSWVRVSKGNIYFLQFGWLLWYIQVRLNYGLRRKSYRSVKW